MARALVIQHLEPEGPAALAQALANEGVEVDVTRVDLGTQLPAGMEGYDGLVVMGGPMSARSDDDFPTRIAELALLREALDIGVPTLGVCLGAQLLAAAAGGSVRPGDGNEIGWGPIELLPGSAEDALMSLLGDPGALIPVLHWHGETYDLPPGAVNLASTDRYDQQAFRVGERAWGLQFHIEVGPDEVATFVESFPADAAQAAGGGAGIVDRTAESLTVLAPRRDLLLERFARLVSTVSTGSADEGGGGA